MRLLQSNEREELAITTFADFYEQERTRAIRLAWLLTHDGSTSEDLVQDAFTRVFHRFDTLDHPGAYLRRVVVNGVYERSRREGREARRIELVARDVPTAVDGPTGGLADAIAQLPLNQRTAVVLRYWADLDHHAIADAMNVRPGTVRSLLSRATAQLRKDIAP
ncbi:MAG: sigma factor-like helix-turn-helix DNA-binding protein [Actinomycetota bacterium]